MEKQLQWCDVCVVCALPEEAEAFLEMVEKHYKTLCERKTYNHSKYDYWLTTIKNEKDELLTLHVTFPSRYGPNEMVSFLTYVLDENQPRIVIMTGICAGDSRQVQLGDLVVAERTFTYDSGKIIEDEHGKQVHLHDTLTYSMDEHMLQFLGIFNTWKPLISRLKLPTPPSGRNESVEKPSPKHRRKIVRHLKAMASGTAVRADHPFDDVRIPVRNAIAIDMEGAAVGLVMKKYPLVPWLIVKGVCDFADPNKADSFHKYAARSSALYALSFIQAYVTNEKLPRLDKSSLQVREQQSVFGLPQTEPDNLKWIEEALTTCEHVIQLDPTDVYAHITMGFLLIDLERYEEALTAYERAIQLDPADIRAHTGKGAALCGLNQYEEALTAFEYAIQLDPSYSLAHRNKGGALYSLKRYEEALIANERAIQLDPTDTYIYINNGLMLVDLKRYEEACVAYEQATQLDPNNVQAHTGKGAALYNLEQYEEALTAFEYAIRLDPSYSLAYSNKGGALYRLKRYEEALIAYGQAIRLDPNNVFAQAGRIEARFELLKKQ